jgi:Protein of unknown function (DUF3016)
MKLTLYAICAIAVLFGGFGCTTESGQSTGPSVVTIQFVNPGSFTDFSVQGRDLQHSVTVFRQQITQTLEPVMESRFPGCFLTMRFTNIDLAGRRNAIGASSARVVRTRTPTRFSFFYVLQDKSGSVIASGSERVVDTARLSLSGNPNQNRLLANESRTLRRWLQTLPVTR